MVDSSGGPPRNVRPRAVGALLRADPERRVLGLVGGADAEELAQQEILGVHRDVGLELALPEPARILGREQALAGALHRSARLRERIVDGRGQGANGVAHAAISGGSARVRPAPMRAARAAASPLRTAPSIVAGQPVSVQAPARNRFGTRVSARRRRRRVLGACAEGRRGLAGREEALEHGVARRGQQAPELGLEACARSGVGRDADPAVRGRQRHREILPALEARSPRCGRRSTASGEPTAAANSCGKIAPVPDDVQVHDRRACRAPPAPRGRARPAREGASRRPRAARRARSRRTRCARR